MANGRTRVWLTEEERELLRLALQFFFTARMKKEGSISKDSEEFRQPLEVIYGDELTEHNYWLGLKLDTKLCWNNSEGKDKWQFLMDLPEKERKEFLADVRESTPESWETDWRPG